MATIKKAVKQTDVNYSKFLGLYEAEDGDTQMKNGVSPAMNNFRITENFHLKTRPGVIPYYIGIRSGIGQTIHAYFSDESVEIAIRDSDVICRAAEDAEEWSFIGNVELSTQTRLPYRVNVKPLIFRFGEKYYILTGKKFYDWSFGDERIAEVIGYVPLVVTGASPDGGGTTLERVNLLTDKRRVLYSADGESTKFILPEEFAFSGSTETIVLSATVDGEDAAFSLSLTSSVDQEGNTSGSVSVIFNEIPEAGTNNVEIVYRNPANSAENRALIESMQFVETFNGATDTRLFFYGNGSNTIYYTEPTLAGAVTAAYIPSLNELNIGDNSSPVTVLKRHYGRLMAFKPDSCWAVSYDTITMEDGTVTAGFYVRPMHSELGADAFGQVATVQNFPRTFCKGSLYDWKQTASYYRDERYARVASEPVQFTARQIDANRVFLYDDEQKHCFYCFLNDGDGTVLVNAYEQSVWYRYSGFYNVTAAARHQDKLVLAMQFGGVYGLYTLSDKHGYDYVPILEPDERTHEQYLISGYSRLPIHCAWESGHLDFGKSNARKYSSYIWVTIAPNIGATARITARSDCRPTYTEKDAGNQTTGLFTETDFSDFSFETYSVPRARRLKIKVKKFVFYKLLIACGEGETVTYDAVPEECGGGVTILSVDQRVRFTSDAK